MCGFAALATPFKNISSLTSHPIFYIQSEASDVKFPYGNIPRHAPFGCKNVTRPLSSFKLFSFGFRLFYVAI